eukprot:583893-Rhodomonas_salina.1
MGLHARMEAQSVFNDAIQEDDDELGIEEWEDWELQLDWRQQKAAQNMLHHSTIERSLASGFKHGKGMVINLQLLAVPAYKFRQAFSDIQFLPKNLLLCVRQWFAHYTNLEPIQVDYDKKVWNAPGYICGSVLQTLLQGQIRMYGCVVLQNRAFPNAGVQRLRAYPFKNSNFKGSMFYKKGNNPQDVVCIVPDTVEDEKDYDYTSHGCEYARLVCVFKAGLLKTTTGQSLTSVKQESEMCLHSQGNLTFWKARATNACMKPTQMMDLGMSVFQSQEFWARHLCWVPTGTQPSIPSWAAGKKATCFPHGSREKSKIYYVNPLGFRFGRTGSL